MADNIVVVSAAAVAVAAAKMLPLSTYDVISSLRKAVLRFAIQTHKTSYLFSFLSSFFKRQLTYIFVNNVTTKKRAKRLAYCESVISFGSYCSYAKLFHSLEYRVGSLIFVNNSAQTETHNLLVSHGWRFRLLVVVAVAIISSSNRARF